MSLNVIFISGQPRSGSTLMAQVIGQHSRVLSAGEIFPFSRRFIDHRGSCGCGEKVPECAFWQQVIKPKKIRKGFRAIARAESHPLMRLSRFLPFLQKIRVNRIPDRLKYGAAALRRLVERAATVAGRPLVLDSSKTPNIALLYRLAGCRVKIIHLVRDSRGIVFSWRGREGKKSVTGRYNKLHTISRLGVLRSCMEYYAYQYFSEMTADYLEASLRLRYEDFAQRPGKWLSKIFIGFGLPDESNGIIQHKRTTISQVHVLSGNPARFNHNRVRIRLDEKWKRHMDWLDRTVTTTSTYPILERYGYV